MILKSLINNPFDRPAKPWKPWYGYLLVAVCVASLGLYTVDRLQGGPVVPTSTVPSLTYNQILAEKVAEQKATEPVVVAEPAPSATVPVVGSTPSDSPLAGGEGEAASDVMVKEIAAKAVAELPKKTSGNLAVPFTSQTPLGNWDAVHEDTCEEASVLMVMKYFQGETVKVLDPNSTDATLLAMVDLESARGLLPSLSAADLGTFVEAYAPTFQSSVVDNPTIDQIKAFIDAGTPVIAVAAGQQLGNPFYTGLGPVYHLFVIRGYDATTFTTNDPGTRHGENYVYSQSVVMNALHDWNGGDPVNGVKRILILTPKK